MYAAGKGTLTNKKTSSILYKKAYKNGLEDAEKAWNELELWEY